MLPDLDFSKGDGLVTVVAQDARTGAVLMVAHADREALERTVATGEMHYRSRTRGLWHKGATSGNVQRVASLTADCDGDAVLARVIPAGPACHRGSRTRRRRGCRSHVSRARGVACRWCFARGSVRRARASGERVMTAVARRPAYAAFVFFTACAPV